MHDLTATLLAEVEDFVHGHRAHGGLTASASVPTVNGCRLTVACPCGVTFERWVTPEDAAVELALLAPVGFGVAPTPWRAVQRAGSATAFRPT